MVNISITLNSKLLITTKSFENSTLQIIEYISNILRTTKRIIYAKIMDIHFVYFL